MENSLNRVFSGNQPNDTGTAGQELAWILACQGGDPVAFNRLVLKWEKPIYNLTLRMLQDREEAAETTQEVFCAAFRKIKSFRQDARFSTWLYRIAVNHCLSRLRKRPPGIHLSLDDKSDNSPLRGWAPSEQSHEARVLRDEEKRRVRRALDSLPEEQKAVVELKFFQELTFEEIAEISSVPISTIKSRLYAGLDLLKMRLARIS